MFHQHTINTYSKTLNEVFEAIKKYLSSSYELGYQIDMPDTVLEHPYGYYPWKKKTGGSLDDFKAFIANQRALMDEAILKAQEDLRNGI